MGRNKKIKATIKRTDNTSTTTSGDDNTSYSNNKKLKVTNSGAESFVDNYDIPNKGSELTLNSNRNEKIDEINNVNKIKELVSGSNVVMDDLNEKEKSIETNNNDAKITLLVGRPKSKNNTPITLTPKKKIGSPTVKRTFSSPENNKNIKTESSPKNLFSESIDSQSNSMGPPSSINVVNNNNYASNNQESGNYDDSNSQNDSERDFHQFQKKMVDVGARGRYDSLTTSEIFIINNYCRTNLW